jgi:hypothetical protein
MDIVESIRLVLTQFTDETISISLAVLVIVFTSLLAYWFYNRRKFHQLTHQIPASVVKNYLDSIIANSTALKSSLFRGGGLELSEGIPSILPTSDLPQGGIQASSASSEELAQKNAEISNLKALLGQKDTTIAELEKMLEAARASNGGGVSEEEYSIVKDEVQTLKSQLEEANAALEAAKSSGDSAGGNPELQGQLDAVTSERDTLKERLMEYAIIEEDLANLKKFQQENEQLKQTIEELKGGSEPANEAAAASPEPASEEPAAQEEAAAEPPAAEEEPAAVPVPEEVTAEENPAADDAATAAASEEMPDVPNNEGEQKSAAELLSEFEKMLG